MIKESQTLRQSILFLLVGAAATLVHVLVFYGLSSRYQIHAVIANIAAFLVAFSVSYAGHNWLTFRTVQKRAIGKSVFKFLLLQLVGLGLNTVITLNIEYQTIQYELGLLLMAVLTPAFTFVISKFWVFRS